jgi:hypothetical protein
MRIALTTLGLITVLAAGPSAHHGHPDFAADRNATIEGTIESIAFQNPHVLIRLRTDDSTVYLVEWRAAGALRQPIGTGTSPVTKNTLAAGDRIIVTGNPSRDASLHAIAAVKQVYRPHDGWRWARTGS